MPRQRRVVGQILKLQRRKKPILPRSTFLNLMKQSAPNSFQFSGEAVDALREVTELFVVQYMDLSNRSGIHAGRRTVQPKDVHFIEGVRHTLHVEP